MVQHGANIVLVCVLYLVLLAVVSILLIYLFYLVVCALNPRSIAALLFVILLQESLTEEICKNLPEAILDGC